MKTLGMAAFIASLMLTSEASAQFFYVDSQPMFFTAPRANSTVVSYSYFSSAPVAYSTSPLQSVFVRSAPGIVVPQPAIAVVPSVAFSNYGIYASRSTYGFGSLRPRGLNAQYYYSPYFIR